MWSPRSAFALLLAAALFSTSLGMPQRGPRVVRQSVSTYASDRGQFLQDALQIPIQTLQAVAMLLTNRQNRVQKRREDLAASAGLQEDEEKGTLRKL